MGNVVAFFGGEDVTPNNRTSRERSRQRRTRAKPNAEPNDISALILETEVKIERFKLIRENALAAAAKIWSVKANHDSPSEKGKALNELRKSKHAEKEIKSLLAHLNNVEGMASSITTAETHKFIASQMMDLKWLVTQQSEHMPDMEVIAETQQDLAEFKELMEDRQGALDTMFSEHPTSIMDNMTSEEEELLMNELEGIVLATDEKPPEGPSAGMEMVNEPNITEDDLNRLLDTMPSAPVGLPSSTREETKGTRIMIAL